MKLFCVIDLPFLLLRNLTGEDICSMMLHLSASQTVPRPQAENRYTTMLTMPKEQTIQEELRKCSEAYGVFVCVCPCIRLSSGGQSAQSCRSDVVSRGALKQAGCYDYPNNSVTRLHCRMPTTAATAKLALLLIKNNNSHNTTTITAFFTVT